MALEKIHDFAHCTSKAGPLNTKTLMDAWPKFDQIAVMATNALSKVHRSHAENIPLEQYALQPIETAPKNGSYILLFGPSGYMGVPLRCEVCRYDPIYRPLQPWVNHASDSFLDGGPEPTFWMPMPQKA